MNQNIVGFIFARGGSKGVPRKNIRLFAGKPLIAYAIQTALNSKYINRVIVSTEDQEITKIAKEYGAEVPFMRPYELAGDTSPEWLSWQHAIKMMECETNEKIDVFVSIPTTAPLRSVEDLDACITKFLTTDSDIVITVKKSDKSPFFNMVTLDNKGFAKIVIPTSNTMNRRQDAPLVYDMTTVAYVAKPDFIMNAQSLFEGNVQTVEITPERALDIDTELDFKIAEFLMTQNQVKNKSLPVNR
jgi:N,N'-diacetyl-8-epilegionaminate cytidylyltransferase